MNSSTLNRRDICRIALGGTALILVPFPRRLAAEGDEPRFFLQVIIPDGIDCSYLFDARPLAMTAAGLKSNYLVREPEAWDGANGTRCLATHLVEPLTAHRQDFSVLNGVVMAAAFDGHEQNMNYVFCGNPFGGDSFLPWLNHGPARRPIDFVSQGRIPAEIANGAAGIPLTPASASALANQLKTSGALSAEAPLTRHLNDRFEANGSGAGRFGSGSRAMAASALHTPHLGRLLADVKLPSTNREDLGAVLTLATEVMRRGAAISAVIELDPEGDNSFLDTHDPNSAKNSAALIGSIAKQLAAVIAHLKATPFDDHRSMHDVTTFVAVSEFSRTMRQNGMPIDGTGTDHNPLTNTVLIGGRGIRGGLVLGASDFATADETLSKAHLGFDPDRLKIMGRPFDFSSGQPRTDAVEEFHADRYLTFSSVANTVMSLFGIPPTRHFLAERNGAAAPLLRHALA